MSTPWLVLDCDYLCHRAHYSVGKLAFEDVRTGVLFGFFKELEALQEQFHTNKIVFVFDHGKVGVRRRILPSYKGKRHAKKLTETEQVEIIALKNQIHQLKTNVLPELGYRNVFYQKGYEGDDVIASVVSTLPDYDTVVVVTADEDMFQVITPNVMCYNPNKSKMMNLQAFTKHYGITPDAWWKVKALAGCSTDEVPGVPGVGEKTAIKYLRGELPSSYKTFQAIRSEEGIRIRKRNVKLVRLPFPGTKAFDIHSDHLNAEAWERLALRLGFKTMRQLTFSRGKRRPLR